MVLCRAIVIQAPGGGGIGQNISHLFGPGTTVLIGPDWFLGLFLDR
jgi:hypothetical protein